MFIVPAQAGTHTPCSRDVARRMTYWNACGYGSRPARGRHGRLQGRRMMVRLEFDRVSVGVIALALCSALPAAAQTRKETPKIGDPPEAMNMRLVGYNDLQGRTAYHPTILKRGSRYIAFVGHHGGSKENPQPMNAVTGKGELNGTSVVD